jgi:hypothetical protein
MCFHVLIFGSPQWVRAYVPACWVERYAERLYHERLLKARNKSASNTSIKEEPLAGCCLMRSRPLLLRTLSKTLPAISTLCSLWEQQFEPREQGGQWRSEPALPAAQLMTSPYDLDARTGREKGDLLDG